MFYSIIIVLHLFIENIDIIDIEDIRLTWFMICLINSRTIGPIPRPRNVKPSAVSDICLGSGKLANEG